MGNTVVTIDTNRVRPFADQPREYFDAGELISLELSIKQRGQLQPAMIRKLTGDRDHDYELVDGQRRWHACTKLGIPLRAVIINPENEEDQFEISVAANFQRSDHTPMEIAKAIERMCTQGGRTEEYVGTLFGKSIWWVNQHRHLNDLVPEIQAMLSARIQGGNDSEVSPSVAMSLARLPKEQQLVMLEEIKARGLTATRAIDKIRRMLLNDNPEKRRKSSDHSRNLDNFARGCIQRADSVLDRMGPDDFRLVVSSLVKTKNFDRLKETIMTAIGRLEVIHRRLTECRASMGSESKPTTAQPVPLRQHAVKEPAMQYSHENTCPKCKTTRVRFSRRSDADLQKDNWVCSANGCLLKISHYNIKIDKTYQPQASAASA